MKIITKEVLLYKDMNASFTRSPICVCTHTDMVHTASNGSDAQNLHKIKIPLEKLMGQTTFLYGSP